jgi:extradiol dioxygenase family protein
MTERRKLVVVARGPRTNITHAFGPVFSLDAAERLLCEVEAAGWVAYDAAPVMDFRSVAEFRAESGFRSERAS